jgi:hypothetical protein
MTTATQLAIMDDRNCIFRGMLIATLRYGVGLLDIACYWPDLMMASPEEFAAIQDLLLELFEVKINYGRNKECNELRDDQPAHDNQTEGPA